MNSRHLLLSAATAILLMGCGNTHNEQPEPPIASAPVVHPVPEPAPAAPDIARGPSSASETEALEEVIVTGSYIRRDNLNLSSPIDITTEADLALAGASDPGNVVFDQRYKSKRLNVAMSQGNVAYVPQSPTRERYEDIEENGVKVVTEHPVSTFSIDVDTASYANVRRFINQGAMPPADAVRIEELVNYFDYRYATPADRREPFSIATELAPSPWHADRHLLHIGLKGYEVARSELPPANLVFLVDTSGSMQAPNKLGLVKSALRMLTRQMSAEDRVSLVVYAGSAGVVLEPTAGNEHGKIERALGQLHAGGSTHGSAGIRLAYSLAQDAFVDGGINRVILATDGDFNVGVTDQDALKELVEEQRRSGVTLSVLGFGQGNYNDAMMQEIAQIGNGNASYIDTFNEARKVLVEEMTSTLATIAGDVKIQVEFNPAEVMEYRLIGYETRHLNREDFNNDKVDAGDIGAGHTVTALYEVTLVGSDAPRIDPLRYGQASERTEHGGELAHVKLRYKRPGDQQSQLTTRVVSRNDALRDFQSASAHFRFSASVAAFAQLLKGGQHTADISYDDVVRIARSAQGEDTGGYRAEFIRLVKTAAELDGRAG